VHLRVRHALQDRLAHLVLVRHAATKTNDRMLRLFPLTIQSPFLKTKLCSGACKLRPKLARLRIM
jgi:hypothetical protein